MATLALSLTLRSLGEITHLWFPVPQRSETGGRFHFSPSPARFVKETRFMNTAAYFLIRDAQALITAQFPVPEKYPVGADDPRAFLSPNRYVESDHPAISSLAQAFNRKTSTDGERARQCFDWVVGYLVYANPIRGLYSSIQALADRKVDCGGFSTLLVALLRASRIPARCVFGWATRSRYGYHAWVEYFDRQEKVWIPCDPSVEHLGKRTKLDAGFGFINDPRVIFSVGEDFEFTGYKLCWPMPLLQCPVVVSLDRGVPRPIEDDFSWAIRGNQR